MPKLWKDTVEEHRHGVRAAILEAAWALASEQGLRGVTMGSVAERAGISRATLYKYFSGVDEILVAAHADHVSQHLTQLEAARSSASSPGEGLQAMLVHYAGICFHRGRAAPADLQVLVHGGAESQHGQSELLTLFAQALRDAQDNGQLRTDIAVPELAAYCVYALGAAAAASSRPMLDRLVGLISEALRLTVDRGQSAQSTK